MASETKQRYIEAVGRRKTAVARVRITPDAPASLLVNEKPLAEYFALPEWARIASESLEQANPATTFAITVQVSGGGLAAQAEAVRHGITRALTQYDPDLRKPLKKQGFLKRDPRVKERKKFGLRKARRAPQWSKR